MFVIFDMIEKLSQECRLVNSMVGWVFAGGTGDRRGFWIVRPVRMAVSVLGRRVMSQGAGCAEIMIGSMDDLWSILWGVGMVVTFTNGTRDGSRGLLMEGGGG